MPILGTIASSYRSAVATAFESIATITLTSTASTISFTSIPSTYTHLQVRYLARHDHVSNNNLYMRLNSDNASNYSRGYIFKDGGDNTIQSTWESSTDAMAYFSVTNSSRTTNNFAGGFINILDYKNTSKNKSVLARTGRIQLTALGIIITAGQWSSTSAVDTITFGTFAGEGNFITNTTFALYGIKTA